MGRPKGSPNKRTIAALTRAGATAVAAQKQEVPRAITTLAELIKTATGYAAKYQRELIAWDSDPANAGKPVPAHIVDNFWLGVNAAGRFATALAPYQDPRLALIKGVASQFEPMADATKVVEGKDMKLNLKDPIELARLYASLVRAA